MTWAAHNIGARVPSLGQGNDVMTYYDGKWYIAFNITSTFYVYSSSDGSTWSEETSVSITGIVGAYHGFDIDRNGYAYILWRSSSTTYRWIRTTQSLDLGWSWDTEKSTGPFTNGTSSNNHTVQCAYDGTTDYLIFFKDVYDGSNYILRYNYSTDRGTTWEEGSTGLQLATATGGNSISVHAEALSNGDVWLLGKDYDGSVNKLGFRKWTASTQTWGSWQYLSQFTPYYPNSFYVDWNGDINIYFGDSSYNYLYYTRGTTTAEFSTNERQVNSVSFGGALRYHTTYQFNNNIPIGFYNLSSDLSKFYDAYLVDATTESNGTLQTTLSSSGYPIGYSDTIIDDIRMSGFRVLSNIASSSVISGYESAYSPNPQLATYNILSNANSLAGISPVQYYSGKYYYAVEKFDSSSFEIYSSADGESWSFEASLSKAGTDATVRWHGFTISLDGYAVICYSTEASGTTATRFNRTTTVVTSSWTWAGWTNNPFGGTLRSRLFVMGTSEYSGTKYIHCVGSFLNGQFSVFHSYSTDNGANWSAFEYLDTDTTPGANCYVKKIAIDSNDNLWMMAQDYDSVQKFGFRKWDPSTTSWGAWQYIISPDGNIPESNAFFVDSEDNCVLCFTDTVDDNVYFTYGTTTAEFTSNMQFVGNMTAFNEVVCVEYGTDIPIILFEDPNGNWRRSYLTARPGTFKPVEILKDFGYATSVKGTIKPILFLWGDNGATDELTSNIYTGFTDAVTHLAPTPPPTGVILYASDAKPFSYSRRWETYMFGEQ